jgi:hypothetical protein
MSNLQSDEMMVLHSFPFVGGSFHLILVKESVVSSFSGVHFVRATRFESQKSSVEPST